MNITDDHWIEDVKRESIPGGSAMNVRRFLVIHNTAGWSAMSSVEGWREKNNGVLAHIIIDRDGTVIQCRPFNRTCGHAGKSAWVDPNTGKRYSGLNSCAIGIELANAADMARTPDVFPKYLMGDLAGLPVPRLEARHKNGGPMTKWERYSPKQILACRHLAETLVKRYHLDDVIGHDDIAPNRKVDPGPAFPMSELRMACGFPPDIPKL